MTNNKKSELKVGDIAKATGVTIRTLHHYEEIGLLASSSRSESGHRVYSEKDLRRLQQILSLKQLGFSLEEIHNCFQTESLSPIEIIHLHQKRVLESRDQLARLYDQLSTLEKTLAAKQNPSVQELLKTIEVIHMHEKYFTQEQLEELKNREAALGSQKMQDYQAQWSTLMEKVRHEAKNGADPSAPHVQKLAQEWQGLVKAFSGGNTGIETQLGSMYKNEPAARERVGMDKELFEFVAKMMSHLPKAKL
jgi:DNA-binding transcriptional MerR regulator